MENKYPNPADRLAASIRITKWLQKQVFDVQYDSSGYDESRTKFFIVPDGFYRDAEQISVLSVDEEGASFLLPFINDIYPFVYYQTVNHVACEIWRDVVDRIREAENWVLHDTYNPDYIRFIDCFNLSGLGSCNSNPFDFVFAHRYEIAVLYQIFVQWSEVQMDSYCFSGTDRLFSIVLSEI